MITSKRLMEFITTPVSYSQFSHKIQCYDVHQIFIKVCSCIQLFAINSAITMQTAVANVNVFRMRNEKYAVCGMYVCVCNG